MRGKKRAEIFKTVLSETVIQLPPTSLSQELSMSAFTRSTL